MRPIWHVTGAICPHGSLPQGKNRKSLQSRQSFSLSLGPVYVLRPDEPWIVGCLVTSLAFAHWRPIALPQLWQPKIARCSPGITLLSPFNPSFFHTPSLTHTQGTGKETVNDCSYVRAWAFWEGVWARQEFHWVSDSTKELSPWVRWSILYFILILCLSSNYF